MNEKGKIRKAYAQGLLQLNGTDGTRRKLEIEERMWVFLDILEEFLDRQARMEGQKTMAYVTTVIPIPDDMAKRLAEELSWLMGKEIDLRISIDESILGGVIVRIGDRIIDGSLKARLQRIRDGIEREFT